MPKKKLQPQPTVAPDVTQSAPEFILAVLGKDPELEWQIADIHNECGGRWTKGNLNNALDRLLKKGAVARAVDPDRSAWWSIVT
jgi:hypothetical protein